MMQTDTPARIFSPLQALYLSFFSRHLYQDVRRNWQGFCFPYLILVLMIYWVPQLMNINRDIADYLDNEAPQYVDQIPEITISGGKASLRADEPFSIIDKKTGNPVAILDTTGGTTDLVSTSALVLLTRDRIVFRDSKNTKETRSFPLSDFGDLLITPKLIYNWLEVFNDVFVILLFPFALLVSFGFHLVQIILLALLGNSFAKYFILTLDLRSLIRLSVVAFTPAILLEAVHAALRIDYPYSSFFSFLIAGGYLFYAVGCNSEKAVTPIRD